MIRVAAGTGELKSINLLAALRRFEFATRTAAGLGMRIVVRLDKTQSEVLDAPHFTNEGPCH